jgi:excisionase family DNA binding protein
MNALIGVELITVAEAARALKVSQSTIWRWIDQGRLPAYRVGPRKVRLKADEVMQLIVPTRHSEANETEWERVRAELSRPLSEEEKQRALAALDAIEALDREYDSARTAADGLDSVEILRQERELRTKQLMDAMES